MKTKYLSKIFRVLCSFLVLVQTNAPLFLISTSNVVRAQETETSTELSIDTTDTTDSSQPAENATPKVEEKEEKTEVASIVDTIDTTQETKEPENSSEQEAPLEPVNNQEDNTKATDVQETPTIITVDDTNTKNQQETAPVSQEQSPEKDTQTLEKPKSEWNTKGDDNSTTSEKVTLNHTYKFPKNEDVQVEFTKLPNNSGNLTIKEIKLSSDEQKKYGSLTDTAYDITSDMEDGTFKYDLKLPLPDGIKDKDITIKYAESLEDLDKGNAKEVENDVAVDKTNGSISVEDLNHFTLFLISADTNGSTGTGAYTSVTGPTITETAAGQVTTGTLILNAPSGFSFDTTVSSVSAAITCVGTACGTTALTLDTSNNSCSSGAGTSQTVTPTSSTITIRTCAVSTNANKRGVTTFSGIKLRPTDGTPLASAGSVTVSGGTGSIGSATYSSDSWQEVAGNVIAGNSTFTAGTPSVPADNSTTSTLTVTLNDQYGNPVSGKTVSVSKTAGPGTPIISAAVATDSLGQATFTVSSSTTGTDTFTATDTTDTVTVTQTADVTFTPATVSSVGTAKSDGYYTVGEVIDLNVIYSVVVNVDTTGGTPTLALNSGGSASYISGSGTNTLTFRYTVAATETSADLDYNATGSLSLNGGTIKDIYTNDTDNTLPSVGTFGGAHAIVIDTTTPTIPTHVSPADGSAYTTANFTLIDWSDSTDTNSISYYYESSYSNATNPDGSFTTPLYTSGALGTSQIATGGTPEGTYYWHVKAVDAANNASSWSTPSWSVMVDNTAPATDPSGLSSTTPLSTPQNNPNIAVDWTTQGTDALSGVDGYSFDFTQNATGTPDQVKDIEETATSAGSTLGDGTWYFNISTVDNAGNWTSTASLGPLIVDTTAPTGTVTLGTATVKNSDLVQEVTVTYDETMDTGVNPTISFVTTSGAWASNGNGAWDGTSQIWTESFTLTDVNETVSGVVVSSSGAQDLATNVEGPSVTASFDVDDKEPVVTINTLVTGDSTPQLTGTIDDTTAPTISVTINGNTYSATNNGDGTWTLADNTISALSDSTYEVVVTAADSNGNLGFDSSILEVQVDTVYPTVGTIIVATDFNPYVRGNSFTIRSNVSDAASGIDSTSCEYTIDGGTTWSAATYTASPERCRATGVTAADGASLTINMRVKDLAGNQTTGVSIARTADTAVPVLGTITVNPDYLSIYTSGTPLLTATFTDTVSPISSCDYRYRITGSGAAGWSAWTSVDNNTGTTAATCDVTILGGTLSDNTQYDFQMRATDSTNHTTNSGATAMQRTVDSTAPIVDAGADKTTNVAILQDATVDASVSGAASYVWSQTAGSGTVTFTPNGAEDTTLSADTDDVYTVQLTVTDNVGQVTSDTMQLTWDQTNPVATINAHTPDPTNVNTPTYTGNATDNLTNVVNVEYRVDGGSWTTATASDGTFDSTNENFMFTTAVLSDGSHTIEVRATDATGNVQTSYATDTLTVDTIKPSGVVTLGTPTLTDADPVQEVTVTYDEVMNTGINPTITFGTTSGTINSNGDGAWDGTSMVWIESFTITDADEEIAGVTVVATNAEDLAANVQNATSAATFDIDTKNPVLNSLTSSTFDGTYGPGSMVNITANYSEDLGVGSTIGIVLDTGTSVTLNNLSGATLSGTYTVGVTGSGENSLDLTVSSITSQNVTDLNGNTLTSTSLPANNIANTSDIVIDTTAPILNKFTSTTSNGVYGPSSVINVTAEFQEALESTSTMTVALDTGVSVVLGTVSGNTLTGSYTVGVTGSGENSTDLTISSITSSDVTDLYTNNTISLTIPTLNNLGDNSNIVVDTTMPDTALTAYTPDPSADQTPAYNGSVTDTGGANIASVEWRLDGGSWNATTAVDGAFDSASEAYTFEVLPKLSKAGHTIEVRSTDSVGNVETTYASDSYTVIANVVNNEGGGNNCCNGNNSGGGSAGGGTTGGGEVLGVATVTNTPTAEVLGEVQGESTESTKSEKPSEVFTKKNTEKAAPEVKAAATEASKECTSTPWAFLLFIFEILILGILYFVVSKDSALAYAILIGVTAAFAFLANKFFCGWWPMPVSLIIGLIALGLTKAKLSSSMSKRMG